MRSDSQLNLPPSLVLSSDKRARTAKAHIRSADKNEYYAELGSCMVEVQRVFGLNLDEFALELKKDPRQLKRQIDGIDRPQIEAVFEVPRFRSAMVIALASKSAGVEVVTEIRVRRIA